MKMTHLEFRNKWKEYMAARGHKEVPNLPLPSYSDPTLLFVNSGMFPLVPFLEGQPHPQGTRLFNTQRCIRPMEFDEIGDNRHTSVFEMIGNWSLGEYFKKEQLEQWYSLLIDELKLDPQRLYASVFVGDTDAPRDTQSIEILQEIFKKYGVACEVAPDNYKGEDHEGLKKYRIFPYGKDQNWWQRGDTVGELGGPDSETFYEIETNHILGEGYPATDSGKFIEIGNSVFMQYKKTEDGWKELSQKNVDFGGGLERLLMVVQDKKDIFSTDLYEKSIEAMVKIFNKKYQPEIDTIETKSFRIIADHLKGAVFMAGDDVIPGSKEQGYILRRAIRRAVKFAYLAFGRNEPFSRTIVEAVIETYKGPYIHLEEKKDVIINIINNEEVKFWKTFVKGLEIADKHLKNKEELTGDLAYMLYETYGFPMELTHEYWSDNKAPISKSYEEDVQKAEGKHQDLSRAGAQQRFKGGLADTKEVTVRYHTAAHLMLSAIQKVLGPDVHQKGQNITDQRLRFDINFGRPITPDEIKKIEDLVNSAINKNLEVTIEEINKNEIRTKGAEGSFMDRYGEKVNVYKMTDPKTGEVYSYEVCGGPHVHNTSEILKSGKFKIVKEESSSSGVRRIKAILE